MEYAINNNNIMKFKEEQMLRDKEEEG